MNISQQENESDRLRNLHVVYSPLDARIALSSKLFLESVVANKPHKLDDAPMLVGMQRSLRLLYIRAKGGDEKANERLFAIHDQLYPLEHSLPDPVARAMEVRLLMAELSNVVAPANPDAKSILTGQVRLTEDTSLQDSEAYKIAAKHWRKGATLKSIAIRAYLEKLDELRITTIDQKRIERDLQELQKWDVKKNGGQSPDALHIFFSTGESLPFQFTAQRWRKRKRTPAI